MFFEELNSMKLKGEIGWKIYEFFYERVRDSFEMKNYSFDVYVDAAPKRRIWFTDINVFPLDTY